MKITAADVFDAYQVLETTKQRSAPMPDKAKFWLARLGRKLRPDFQHLCEQRDELITSFDKKNSDGQFFVPPDVQDDFNKRWKDIMSTEIELSDVDRRPLSFFRLPGVGPDAVEGPLSVAEMTALEPFLTDEE